MVYKTLDEILESVDMFLGLTGMTKKAHDQDVIAYVREAYELGKNNCK